MNLSGCRIAGTDIKSSYGRLSGSVTPLLGAAAFSGSWPPSGWTSLQNANADDAFVILPFNFTNFVLNSTSYSSAFVGSNLYITFGSGSTEHFNLSASNPLLNKLMINSADYSYQRVAYKTFPDATIVRFEGYNSVSGTPGSSNIIYECLFINPLRYTTKRSVIALMMGNAANTGGVSLFGIANTNAFYANGFIAQNTSYVFEATNDTGTAWTMNTGSYIPLF